MKRADIVEGAEYAVLAPSQRDKVDGRYGPNTKRVRVLDTQPLHVERYVSFGRYNDLPDKRITGFEPDARVTVKDKTKAVTDSDYDAKEAKRFVRCLVATENHGYDRDKQAWRYAIEVVPISQVAMPWSEYEERRAAAKARREAEDRAFEQEREAKSVAAADRERRAAQLNVLLAGTDLQARVILDQVAIIGPPLALTEAAELLANA